MQSRKSIAGVVVVAALLATAGIAGAVVTDNSSSQSPAQDAQASNSDTITVTGSGQVQAQADSAVIEVAVVATGDDIETVREHLAENASQLRDALAEAGVGEDRVRTANYDISSNSRYGGPSEEQPEHSAVHGFTIAVNETDAVGDVIDTAATNGADEIDDVRFTLSSEEREELRQDALEAAMGSARSDASAIASAEDLTITGVDRASTTYDQSPYRVQTDAMSGGDGASTSIDSGPVTVSASVTVVYDVGS